MNPLPALLTVCALSGALATVAVAAPPTAAAPVDTEFCGVLGAFAHKTVVLLQAGQSPQSLLDSVDRYVVQAMRDSTGLHVNRYLRRITTEVAQRPEWTPAQAASSIETACLRGDYP